MGFKEYDDYDALGLAELVVTQKHYDEARGAIATVCRKGLSRACPSS